MDGCVNQRSQVRIGVSHVFTRHIWEDIVCRGQTMGLKRGQQSNGIPARGNVAAGHDCSEFGIEVGLQSTLPRTGGAMVGVTCGGARALGGCGGCR